MSRRVLLVDAPSGIAGDMFLAALVDLGFSLSALEAAFADADIGGLRLGTEEVLSHGLRGRRLLAQAPDEQPHRGLSDCLDVVRKLKLPEPAAALTRRFFERLAAVEAKLHGTSVEKVHFHELGAIDALVDLAGAALGLHELGVEELLLRDLATGKTVVNTAHGSLPVPAPATLELLHGFDLRELDQAAETITPTGALILAETARPCPPDFTWRPLRSGYGAGTRELSGQPNLLRLTLAETDFAGDAAGNDAPRRRVVTLLRCSLDDMNPERCGYLMERLLAGGALDVRYQPVQMKKNRPGLEVEVLCETEAQDALAEVLLTETTTLGLLVRREERLELRREVREIATPHGPVRMKIALLPGGGRRAAPEYEDCARLARETGLPLAAIEEAARCAWRDEENGP